MHYRADSFPLGEHRLNHQLNLIKFFPDEELPYPGIDSIKDDFTKPTDILLHKHPHFAEIVFVVSGSIIYNFSNTCQTLEMGDILFLCPNIPHRAHCLSCSRISIQVSTQFLAEAEKLWKCIYQKRSSNLEKAFLLKASLFTKNEIEPTIYKLINEQRQYRAGWEIKACSISLDLICDLSREYNFENEATEAIHNDLILHIQQYIDSHLDTALDRNVICKKFFISYSSSLSS